MKRSLWSVAVAMGLAVSAATAQAQVPSVNPLSFGLSGGLSVASGDFGDAVNAGYNVSGLVGLHLPTLPIRFRGELQYQRFGWKDVAGLTASGNTSTIGGIVNAIVQMPTPLVSPYFTGGVGMYHLSSTDVDSQNKFGYNLGVGISFHLSSINTFVEADYQSISVENGSMKTIPVRFGLTF
jgi:opacity protein-like surface antigen